MLPQQVGLTEAHLMQTFIDALLKTKLYTNILKKREL